MPEHVKCPHCARVLLVREENLGSMLQCPACQGEFEATAAKPAQLAIYTPEETPQDEQKSNLEAYAANAGLNPAEQHSTHSSGSIQAGEGLQAWKAQMPPVLSAYQPSGELPSGATGYLFAGALVAAMAGLLGAAVTAAIAIGLMYGLTLFIDWLAGGCGKGFCLAVIVFLAVGVIGYGLALTVLGYLAGIITTKFSQMAKNRNPNAAGLFSMGGAAAGLVAIWGMLWWTGFAPNPIGFPRGLDWARWVLLGAVILGSFWALWLAWYTGMQLICDTKFCEECGEFMRESPLGGLHLGAAKVLVLALTERNLQVADEIVDYPKGSVCNSVLFDCEHCGKGYLETTIQYRATYPDSEGEQELTESWLAASLALENHETQVFRKKLTNGGESV